METNTIQETSDNILSVEIQQMEKRITESITNHNPDSMKSVIQDTMKEMLKPIQKSIGNLLVLKTSMESQEGRITHLKQENIKLSNKISQLKTEVSQFQKKLNQLEDRSL